ncbi:hypothetical protein HRW23_17875 [Streptomyces lunaelactis]|uniref:hypothetical protein n=1 Tax=Streptomyces lunaelactis TaxID=1535768 RepID=UPI0015858898|nr:hypothetical protein [Streptomyces lunaelactis]NUK04540.1 hypothetical protein [Streptomyces lunaelactis]NUK18896.1 hypothetical protein [Streptomyces lunaelactis]NUK74734.1 hypothetical protein [Streptomyces lunaelactis]NUK79236.1 hypothetical protein [Streptomyces lunaelactis]
MREESTGKAADAVPPTPDQLRLIEFGEALYRRIAADADIGHVLLPEDGAVAVVHRVRGGGTILVAADRSVLFFGSALDMSAALIEFRAGRRTPVERFQ